MRRHGLITVAALLAGLAGVWAQPVTPALPSTATTRDLLRSTNAADFRLRLGLVDTNVSVVAATGINTDHLSTNAGVLALKEGGALPAMDGAAVTNLTPSLTNAAYLWVDTAGDDDTAVRGVRERPFATIAAAVSASQDGDTIWIGSGSFTNESPVELKQLTLIGQGWNATKIYSDRTHTLVLTNNCHLCGLRVEVLSDVFAYPLVFNQGTNVILDNVAAYGWSDVLYQQAPLQLTANNCLFKSAYDVYNTSYSGSTPTEVIFNQCQMIADGHCRSTENGLTRCFGGLSQGSYTLNGCFLLATNAVASGASIGVQGPLASTIVVHLNNCTVATYGAVKSWWVDNYDDVEETYGSTNSIHLTGTYDMSRVRGPVVLNGNPVMGGASAFGSALTNMVPNTISLGIGAMALLVRTNGLSIMSNSVAGWPAAPSFEGEAFIANSNGVIYLLTSGTGNAWVSTNKLAP